MVERSFGFIRLSFSMAGLILAAQLVTATALAAAPSPQAGKADSALAVAAQGAPSPVTPVPDAGHGGQAMDAAGAEDATQAPQGRAEAALAADNACTECHDQSSKKLLYFVYQTRHGVKGDAATPSCQQCHGRSETHIKKTALPTDIVFNPASKHLSAPEVRNAACLACHAASAQRANWSGSLHESEGVSCTGCHNIHAPEQKVLNRASQALVCFQCHKDQRAQVNRISAHPLVTRGLATGVKMVCSDCHNPHGSTGPNLLVKSTVNETCFTCHAEKRGPYLWEHEPVVESCTICHTPHGSANTPLLKARTPWICQDCHSGDHANQVQSGANLRDGEDTTINDLQMPGARAPRQQFGGRNCLNCHALVHGSNHPAGAKLSR
jgi:DmsE family decaheme c-type cytochrome